jgi:hypothetical protein
MKQLLAGKWAEFLRNQPETGMGYQTGDITLADGRVFHDVIIDSGYISKIRGRADIPFDVDEVVAIEITGKRWNWDE